jgi:glutamate/aspartate transport system substrate-binding protein
MARCLAWSAAALAMSMLPLQARAGDTLTKIAATKRIFVGHRQDEKPFSYVVDGKVVGYATDICLRVIAHLRQALHLAPLQAVFVPVSTATRFIQLGNGSIDLECASTTNNAERRKLAEFSYPYFLATTRYVAQTKNHLTTIADLAGHSVASTSGTVDVDQLNAVNLERHLNISVMLARSHTEAFKMVETGQASAFVMDDILLVGLIASTAHPGDYEISSEAFNRPEPYGIIMPPGDVAFKDAVNRGILALVKSHEIEALYRKWFTQPIAPYGQNLNLPMSPALRAWFASPREYLD